MRPVARAEPRQAGTRDGSFACARKLVAVAALTTEQSQQTHEARTDGDRETTLVDGLGRTTRYRATEVGGQWRATEILGPGCEGCGPGNLRMRYDDQGRLLARWSVNGEGRGYRYDEQGRIIEIVRLAAPDREGLRPGVQKQVSPPPTVRAGCQQVESDQPPMAGRALGRMRS